MSAPEQLIVGKAARCLFTPNSGQPGGGAARISLSVEKIASIASNNPLIVIDGVPLENTTNSDGELVYFRAPNAST